MDSVDFVIKSEVKKITIGTLILTFFMFTIIYIFKKSFMELALGSFIGGFSAIFNFFLTAISVKKVINTKDPSRAKFIMFVSYIIRMALLSFAIYIGIKASYIDLWGVILPLFFPKIIIMATTLLERRGKVGRTKDTF